MKGNNDLMLNEATMIEAVQEYLDKRMTVFSPKVESVKGASKNFSWEFTVSVTDRKAVNGPEQR